MAKRKTKQQKLKSKIKYSLPGAGATATVATALPVKKEARAAADPVASIYMYDPIFLRKDLWRTVIFSLVILGLQISLYFWLR